MKTIHKYPLLIIPSQLIESHETYTPLAFQYQAGTPCLWMEVYDDSKPVTYQIKMYGTGEDIASSMYERYIGTLQAGPLVVHAYIVEPR